MELAHVRRGTGPAVIVLQQLDPPAFWAKTIDALTDTCEVIAVDLPGFGETSPLPEGRASVSPLADAVATWIAEAGLSEGLVVGNSLGGAVAIEVAKRDGVAGAVAISPLGLWTEREAARPLRSLAVGGAVARAVASRPGVITRTGLGRTVAVGNWSRAHETWLRALPAVRCWGWRRRLALPPRAARSVATAFRDRSRRCR